MVSSNAQPRHVAWLGIEPATRSFTGWHSIHWAIPARANTATSDPGYFPPCDLSKFPYVCTTDQYLACFFKKYFIYLLLERGEVRETEKQHSVASRTSPSGVLAHNWGKCPDQELNWWSLGLNWGRPTHWATPVRAI